MRQGNIYVVKTDLPPEMVTRIGVEIFAAWVDFALGSSTLGGKRLVYPTGRYAASLRFRQEGEATVAIIADEDVAPEAAILEYGHGEVDLKTRLQPGRAYPMHRLRQRLPGSSLRRVGSGPPSLRASMWAEIRTREATGFASIGPESDADSWIIPAMPAYSPALNLAMMATAMSRGQ